MFDCTNGIYFRSVSLQTETIHADLISGGPWDQESVKGSDWNIPGAVGEEVRARTKGPRDIELRLDVFNSGDSEAWHLQLMALADIFDFSLDLGTLELHGPYLGIPEGTVYSIEARAKSLMPGPVLAHMSYQRRSYVLRAPYPIWIAESGS